MWRNPQGAVIYAGKAKNLKKRLSSYFSGKKDVKTSLLVSSAASIEYITTSNEYEAFLLENTLIKKHSPRYNINLKDGKSYPVLRVTREDFPRLLKTRKIVKDGSRYFGPFPDSGALDDFLDALSRVYPLRRCKKFRRRESPCMYWSIGRCAAPCASKISRETYNEFIGEISSLLEGKGGATEAKIKAEMKMAAESLNFEKAARLRDGLSALAALRSQNVVEGFDGEDRDYIAHWSEGELVSFTVLKVRRGKLEGRDNFRCESLAPDSDLASEFFGAYYTDKSQIPPKIYVMEISSGGSLPPVPDALRASSTSPSNGGEAPVTPQEAGGRALARSEILRRWLSEKLGASADVIEVNGGIENAPLHTAAIEMARQNAKEDIVRRLRERGDTPALEELKSLLGLPALPARIEGFDIAHIGGKFPVAGMVSFLNGNPDKKNYRYFRLKTTDGVIDDFASMREAAARRYSRLANDGAALPDLILIDGGAGQVGAVKGVLDALGLDIPIAGLAKRDEEIWLPRSSSPIKLPRRSDALRLLQRVRDETHRFATSLNQRLRTKENTSPSFSALRGVGPKKALALAKEFSALEDFAKSDAPRAAKILKTSESRAAEILREARALAEERAALKEKESLALSAEGTTPQNAERARVIDDLAASALSSD